MDDLRNEKISRSLPPGTFAWKQMELELRPDLISKVRLYPFEGEIREKPLEVVFTWSSWNNILKILSFWWGTLISHHKSDRQVKT